MKLHNDEIIKGDKVYDIVDGAGVAKRVDDSEGYMYVAFDSHAGRQVRYRNTGVRNGRDNATLYWHNPLVLNPPKDSAAWSLQRRIVEAVAGVL